MHSEYSIKFLLRQQILNCSEEQVNTFGFSLVFPQGLDMINCLGALWITSIILGETCVSQFVSTQVCVSLYQKDENDLFSSELYIETVILLCKSSLNHTDVFA